jgi:hypothetical protein
VLLVLIFSQFLLSVLEIVVLVLVSVAFITLFELQIVGKLPAADKDHLL